MKTDEYKYISMISLLQVYFKLRDSDSFFLVIYIDELEGYYIFETVDDYDALERFSFYAKSDVDEVFTHTIYKSTFIYKKKEELMIYFS